MSNIYIIYHLNVKIFRLSTTVKHELILYDIRYWKNSNESNCTAIGVIESAYAKNQRL